jgi:hypothetical protein
VPLCAVGGGVGSVLSHHQLCDRKQKVNATFATDHQADPAHNKFHILRQICSRQYFTTFFVTGEDYKKTGSIPGDTTRMNIRLGMRMGGIIPIRE